MTARAASRNHALEAGAPGAMPKHRIVEKYERSIRGRVAAVQGLVDELKVERMESTLARTRQS